MRRSNERHSHFAVAELGALFPCISPGTLVASDLSRPYLRLGDMAPGFLRREHPCYAPAGFVPQMFSPPTLQPDLYGRIFEERRSSHLWVTFHLMAVR